MTIMAWGIASAQTPQISAGANAVVNNASYAPRGLPTSGIAQGSIFAIFGTNLGGGTLAQQQSYPLSKALNGTSIKVTVGGTSVDAIPIYTVANQVGAVLPSNTPIGEGTVVVTYSGQTSASHAITVVPSSFGTFSINQQGTGPAVVTDANYVPITVTNPAKPGQTLILWGTGLGKGLGDDAAVPVTGNITGVKVDVYIGGQTAAVSYAGRSGCCSGLDQIVFTVPSGPLGCDVSVIVVTNDSVASNTTTMPIAQNGVCSDVNGFSSNDLTSITNGSSLRIGSILVGRSTIQTPGTTLPNGMTVGGGTTTTDDASAFFVKYTPQQLIASQGLFAQASFGSCIVNSFTGSSTTRLDPIMPTYLDAGPTITMSGGLSTQTLVRDPKFGFYTIPASSSGAATKFIPDNGASLSFSNGSGGADVETIQNATLTLGAPIIWTNMDQISNIPRASDLLIMWTGGNTGTYVQITGTSSVIGSTAASSLVVTFSCTAPASAGRFSVPKAVLLQLPASSAATAGGFSIPTGSLSVGNYTNPVTFYASGIDAGYMDAYITTGKSVVYQ
jgi:uncharacterized protein (TIGR03437 family)